MASIDDNLIDKQETIEYLERKIETIKKEIRHLKTKIELREQAINNLRKKISELRKL